MKRFYVSLLGDVCCRADDAGRVLEPPLTLSADECADILNAGDAARARIKELEANSPAIVRVMQSTEAMASTVLTKREQIAAGAFCALLSDRGAYQEIARDAIMYADILLAALSAKGE